MSAEKNGIRVEPFDGNQFMADMVARLHLRIRIQQRKDGTNQFHRDVTPILNSQADLHGMQSYYIESGGNFWIAKDDADGIVGFVGLAREDDHVGTLKRMAVLKEHRRRGIGQQLGETLIAWAKEHDFEAIELGTGRQEEAHDLYLKLGFKDEGFDKDGANYQMRLDLIA